MKVLVDTNVISELKRGANAAPRVVAWFAAIAPQNIFTSVIVLGEIRRGIELVARRDKQQADALERWYALVRERLGIVFLRSTSPSWRSGRESRCRTCCRPLMD